MSYVCVSVDTAPPPSSVPLFIKREREPNEHKALLHGILSQHHAALLNYNHSNTGECTICVRLHFVNRSWRLEFRCVLQFVVLLFQWQGLKKIVGRGRCYFQNSFPALIVFCSLCSFLTAMINSFSWGLFE